jgi:hypothetical protein
VSRDKSVKAERGLALWLSAAANHCPISNLEREPQNISCGMSWQEVAVEDKFYW